MKNIILSILSLLFIVLISCQNESTSSNATVDFNGKIFQLKTTDIAFNNEVKENISVNTITYDGMLQGAGVAVLDFNNDGLEDIYFCGNMVGDKLYQNNGDWKFEDVTESKGILNNGSWSTGVAVADINGDGWDDLYVCKFLFDDPEKRKNELYINNGKGSFKESAAQYGLDDPGYSIMANFFDMDNDGDLDMYLVNQPPNSLVSKKNLKGSRNLDYTDRMYKNENGRFTDVTNKSKMEGYNYSLSATAADLNNDGFTDLFVACDYEEPDMLYMNNGNSTFEDKAHSALKHISNFSMGVDIADINNDGLLDIYCVDMVAEDNFRQKTNMSGMNPEKFWNLANNGYHLQYMFNALHLNNGNNSFSEIAQMAGVSNTDWSWTPLFMDMDNDGLKDLFITNGIIKEMRNKDFEIWRKKFTKEKEKERKAKGLARLDINPLEIAAKAPSHKIANYVYRNQGSLEFENKVMDWGFEKRGWSQGAAYADLDNDGDLDLVINNMNSLADLYENKSSDHKLNNYISIELEGYNQNTKGLNSRIEIKYDGKKQILDHSPFRGYMSTSQDVAHFGLGGSTKVESIIVRFPDGTVVQKGETKANQVVKIRHSDGIVKPVETMRNQQLFAELETNITHQENDFDDYKREILIPYKMSSLGPHIAKGDVNKDGNEDFYLGGSLGKSGQLYLGTNNGFLERKQSDFEKDYRHEDGGAAFADIDNDGDLDLYVSSGGNEYNIEANTPAYQDRIYFNDGKGNFSKQQILPYMNQSTSRPCFMDFDDDGDLDVFVCGRQYPGKYGVPASSILLEQVEGKFVDVTSEKGQEFINSGMTTDAKWVDIDGDNKNELLTCGEWMPIIIYEFENGSFRKKENQSLKNTKGLWNKMEIVDIDNNGVLDIIGGNLGLNNKYKATVEKPFKVFVNDFDKNGTHDVYLGYYDKEGNCYPVRGRQCSSEQMPFVKDKFESYENFATATIDQVLDGKLDGSFQNECQTFAHTVYLGESNGNYRAVPLSREGQVSPTYGIVVEDFNADGQLDIYMTGNLYDREVETTRSDAGTGHMYFQNKEGEFNYSHSRKTGLVADKDAREAISLKRSDKSSVIVVVNNNNKAQLFEKVN